MSLDPPNLPLLIKLMGMTQSKNDGEALAAVRKANEQLKKFGGSWESLLLGKVVMVGDPFASIDKPPTPHRAPPPPVPPPLSRPPPPPPPPKPRTGFVKLTGNGAGVKRELRSLGAHYEGHPVYSWMAPAARAREAQDLIDFGPPAKSRSKRTSWTKKTTFSLDDI